MVSAVPSDFGVVAIAGDTSSDYSSEGGPPRDKTITVDQMQLFNLNGVEEARKFLRERRTLGVTFERPTEGLPVAEVKLSAFDCNQEIAKNWYDDIHKTKPSLFRFRLVLDATEMKEFEDAHRLLEFILRKIARAKSLRFNAQQRDIFTEEGINGEKLGKKYGNFGAFLVESNEDDESYKPPVVVVLLSRFEKPCALKAFRSMLSSRNDLRYFQVHDDTGKKGPFGKDMYDCPELLCAVISDHLFGKDYRERKSV